VQPLQTTISFGPNIFYPPEIVLYCTTVDFHRDPYKNLGFLFLDCDTMLWWKMIPTFRRRGEGKRSKIVQRKGGWSLKNVIIVDKRSLANG